MKQHLKFIVAMQALAVFVFLLVWVGVKVTGGSIPVLGALLILMLVVLVATLLAFLVGRALEWWMED